MNKIHVYFMPGMAASSAIFERISLPEDLFEIHLLNWILPNRKETLQEYAKRMAENVIHDDVVLVGVSFGGILVQEMKQYLNVRKVIIISSVKSNRELPRRMKFAKKTKVHKLIPTRIFEHIEIFSKYTLGLKMIKKRLQLYEKFLAVRQREYIDWSINQIINWERKEIDNSVIHIHGDNDNIFPIKYIGKCVVVSEGTHIMILNKYRWINTNLPKIILD
jgi:esterase/lipase